MKDVVVVGGGIAGIAAALEAAKNGAKVSLVEKGEIGGGFAAYDLLPSKVYSTVAQILDFVEQGVRNKLIDSKPQVNLEALLNWRAQVLKLASDNICKSLEDCGVSVVRGQAKFRKDGIDVCLDQSGTAVISFKPDVAIIATGSRPRRNPKFPYDGKKVLTTRDVLRGPELPLHVIVVGSGPTGVEYAYLFNALGARVTFLASRNHVLPHEDEDVAAVLQESLVHRGIDVVTRSRVASIFVSTDASTVQTITEDQRVYQADAVLVAIGQEPFTEGLGLEDIGIELDSKGRVPVDEFMRTSVPGVYACGDVTGRFMIASVAMRQAVVAVRHALGLEVSPMRYDVIASSVFSEPQVASVGVTEGVAKFKGISVAVYKSVFRNNLKASLEGRNQGMIKVVGDVTTGRVLGGSIVGPEASELISILSLAVSGGITVDSLKDAYFITPTYAEAFKDLAPSEVG